MRRLIVFVTLVVLVLALPLAAVAKNAYPEVIELAEGLQPEGITEGIGNTFYYGTLNGGAIFRGDFRSGAIEQIVAPGARAATGMSFDVRSDLLYVAGAFGSNATVYNGRTGAEVATIPLTTGGFINDVTVAGDAVYFSDSFQPYLYRLALEANGSLPDPAVVEAIELTGDWVQVPQAPPFVVNANGIVATKNGGDLLLINSTTGLLYRVDPGSGHAEEVDLGGVQLIAGDGLAMRGHTLYVVQNAFNMIGVVELDPGFASGEYVGSLTDPDLNTPTTAAVFGNALYAINARFSDFPPTDPVPADAEFQVVRVEING